MRVAVAGATGRTGRVVVARVLREADVALAAALTAANDPQCGRPMPFGGCQVSVTDRLEAPCDVLIDFTVPDGTMQWLAVCLDAAIPMVIGTTGHDERQRARIRDASRTLPIVKAGNFSIGVAVLLRHVAQVARVLGDDFDIEIVETHHRHKADAPSGTALTLLDEIAAHTGRSPEHDAVFGRRGTTGPRPDRQIGVHAVRMGDVVGRHEVHFSGPGETLTLTHNAQSREPFAAGALRAASWVVRRPPGLYTIADVLADARTPDHPPTSRGP